MTKKNKPGQGRPPKIKSQFPLVQMSTRISKEAMDVLKDTDNKAFFIDEAIKEKAISYNIEHE